MAQLVSTEIRAFPDFPKGLKVFSAHPRAAEYSLTPIIIDMAGDGYSALVKLNPEEARTIRDGLAREIEAWETAEPGREKK